MRNLRKRNYEERRATKRISIKGTEERQEEKERRRGVTVRKEEV